MFLRATFAYFTASVTGNDTASSVIVKTAKIGTITYTNGQDVKLENALPGASDQKTFTVKSDASTTSDIQYGLKWVNVSNELTEGTDSELVYTISGSADKGGTPITVTETNCPRQDGSISGTATLKPGETHEYTLTVTFKETYSDQNSNQDKNFKAKIEVVTGDENEIYFNDTNKTGTTTKPVAQ